jgi:hypothetical protein
VSIFVSIAAYRDPELGPTIEDCLTKARRPEQLRFGICWQHALEEIAPALFTDPRFQILDVDWRMSRGACWARAEIMKLWRGEDWFLQIDSHHRFVDGWDEKLLAQAAATGSAKPILTTYAPVFKPGAPESFGTAPTSMAFDRFTEDGLVLFRPAELDPEPRCANPGRARFLSAHFLFAPGRFVEEVPYDPDLYFIGEEISLTVRAFTHGYDLFHPSQIIVWHEYTRAGRPKHWDDHRPQNGVARSWDELDIPSRARVRRLLLAPETGRFGCGTLRSVADYEAYAGVSFLRRRAQDYTRARKLPPNPPQESDWAERTHDWRLQIDLETAGLPAAALDDPQFWYVAIFDAHGNELSRCDAHADELRALLAGAPSRVSLLRHFESTAEPVTWTVMFHSKSQGWLESRLTGAVQGEVVARPHEIALPEPLAPPPYPRAVPELILTEAENGYVVTDPRAPQTNLLVNPSAALLLELANGRHSLSEIVDAVRDLCDLPRSPEPEIRAFFETARQNGLLNDIHAGNLHV